MCCEVVPEPEDLSKWTTPMITEKLHELVDEGHRITEKHKQEMAEVNTKIATLMKEKIRRMNGNGETK